MAPGAVTGKGVHMSESEKDLAQDVEGHKMGRKVEDDVEGHKMGRK
ncbi:MAG: hypothetical protein ABR575_02000 [Actinomycetota bacterium]